MRHSPGRSEIIIPGPSKTVDHAALLLEPQSTILDLGAGIGRNGHYLSQRGHRVLSIERERLQIFEGRKIIRSLGNSAIRHTFIEADMRSFNLNERFDAVIASYSLQELAKEEAFELLEKMKRMVKPGGLNILDAYIASPQQQYEKPEYTLFEEGELKRLYEEEDWGIAYYESTGIKPASVLWDARNRTNKAWLESQEGLIARETKLASTKQQLLALAEYMENSNPERAEELRLQAASL